MLYALESEGYKPREEKEAMLRKMEAHGEAIKGLGAGPFAKADAETAMRELQEIGKKRSPEAWKRFTRECEAML